MNLVKAQEYAASLPLAELKKYADGLNPSMIPPWLATGEMEAKTKRAEMANNLQGAAQGQKPSIKEQVEKKAGLMALQQLQKQQMQSAQPTPTGGPVPEGTPEPQQQPQPQAGLDQLQSNIQMAGGGIVAFATGDQVKAGPEFIKFLRQMGLDYIDFTKSSPETQANLKEMFRAAGPAAEAAAAAPAAAAAAPAATAAKEASLLSKMATGTGRLAGAAVRKAGLPGLAIDAASHMGDYKIKADDNIDTSAAGTMRDLAKGEFGRVGTGLKRGLGEAAMDLGSFGANLLDYVVPGKAPVSSAYDRMLKENVEGLQGPEGAAPERGRPTMVNDPRLNPDLNTTPTGPGARPQAGLPSAARPQSSASATPAAPKPQAAAPAAASTAPAPDSYDAMLRASMAPKPERSIQSLIDEQKAIDKGLGLDEPAGKAKLERIAEIKQQYAATQMTPMQELIAMLGKSGQYKGLSGMAPAYTSMAEKKREAGLKHAKDINELMGGVEDTQRGEKTASKKNVGTAREKDVENANLFARDKMQTLGNVRGQDIQAAVTTRGQDLQYKAAMAAAMQRGDNQEIAKINAASQLVARDETINNWQTQLKELAKMPTQASKAKIADIERQIDGRTKSIYTQFGITIPEAPGAASPGGTTRMRFDAQGNQIK